MALPSDVQLQTNQYIKLFIFSCEDASAFPSHIDPKGLLLNTLIQWRKYLLVMFEHEPCACSQCTSIAVSLNIMRWWM